MPKYHAKRPPAGWPFGDGFPALNAMTARWYRLAVRSGYRTRILALHAEGRTPAEISRHLGGTGMRRGYASGDRRIDAMVGTCIDALTWEALPCPP